MDRWSNDESTTISIPRTLLSDFMTSRDQKKKPIGTQSIKTVGAMLVMHNLISADVVHLDEDRVR